MNSDRQQLDPIERALLELREVERCGVEARTPIDEGVLRQPVQVAAGGSSVGRVLRWTRVAAVLGIVAVSWSVMFSFELSSLRTKSESRQATPRLTGVQTEIPTPDHVPTKVLGNCNGTFVSNFTGPTGAMASSPSFHDYDGDGDVDLADFQKFQLDCTGPA